MSDDLVDLSIKIEELCIDFVKEKDLEPCDLIKVMSAVLLKLSVSLAVDGKEVHAILAVIGGLNDMALGYLENEDEADEPSSVQRNN